MTVSAILVLTTPPNLPAVLQAVDALDWAQAHQRDDTGRVIVTVEAESSDAAADRLRVLKGLAGVLAAEMVIHCLEDEPPAAEPAGAGHSAADLLNAAEALPPRSHYARLKARGNY